MPLFKKQLPTSELPKERFSGVIQGQSASGSVNHLIDRGGANAGGKDLEA